jgi:hypothetical protein
MEDVPRYVDEREVSRLTSRALSTLRNERCLRRGIPYLKCGRRVLYRLDDVVNFMESRRVHFEEAQS